MAKIGICCLPYENTYGRYGDDKFIKIKQHGYNSVDYNVSDTDCELYSMDEAALEEKINKEAESARAAGVCISQVHGPWRYPPQDGTEEDRAERLEKMQKAVRITAMLGCKYLVIHPIMPFGTHDLELDRGQETYELNKQFFRALVDHAKQHGVTICMENMPMLQFSLATPAQVLAFVKDFDDENLKICLDTGHVAVFPGASAGSAVREMGAYIKTLHIHDNEGDRDAHLYPTAGIVDWPDFFRALDEIGFDGSLSLETFPAAELNDEQFEEEGLRLNRLFKELIANK